MCEPRENSKEIASSMFRRLEEAKDCGNKNNERKMKISIGMRHGQV